MDTGNTSLLKDEEEPSPELLWGRRFGTRPGSACQWPLILFCILGFKFSSTTGVPNTDSNVP